MWWEKPTIKEALWIRAPCLACIHFKTFGKIGCNKMPLSKGGRHQIATSRFLTLLANFVLSLDGLGFSILSAWVIWGDKMLSLGQNPRLVLPFSQRLHTFTFTSTTTSDGRMSRLVVISFSRLVTYTPGSPISFSLWGRRNKHCRLFLIDAQIIASIFWGCSHPN